MTSLTATNKRDSLLGVERLPDGRAIIPRWLYISVHLLVLLGAVNMLLALVNVALASAAAPGDVPANTLLLPTDQLWTLLAGAIAPIFAYVLNHYAPWVSEKIKAVVQVVAAAIAGGILQSVTTGDVGFNDTTLQYVITAVVAALFAHRILWQPSTIAKSLGAGSDAKPKTS